MKLIVTIRSVLNAWVDKRAGKLAICSTVKQLWIEVKKDLLFFALCGAIVAFLESFCAGFQYNRVGAGSPFMPLFKSFLPHYAILLITFVLFILGMLENAVASYVVWRRWLETIVSHVVERLIQFVSASICFIVGLVTISISHRVATHTGSGHTLAFWLTIYSLELVIMLFGMVGLRGAIKPLQQRDDRL